MPILIGKSQNSFQAYPFKTLSPLINQSYWIFPRMCWKGIHCISTYSCLLTSWRKQIDCMPHGVVQTRNHTE